MSRVIISASVLNSDFSRLGEEVGMLNQSAADWIHLDVMDGEFVPNITFGVPVVESIARHAKKPLDVHLMIVHPERYIEHFAKAGASTISVHIEACTHLHSVLTQIVSAGCNAGIAINPHTPIHLLENVIAMADQVILMAVNPGFGGQALIAETFRKIVNLRKLIETTGSKAVIEIDGGVNHENAAALVDAGADVLVGGHVIFRASDPLAAAKQLKSV